MTATSPIAPNAVFSNGRPANTAVSVAAPVIRHGLEAEPELYAKVVTRLHNPGEAVSLEDALARLELSPVH